MNIAIVTELDCGIEFNCVWKIHNTPPLKSVLHKEQDVLDALRL